MLHLDFQENKCLGTIKGDALQLTPQPSNSLSQQAERSDDRQLQDPTQQVAQMRRVRLEGYKGEVGRQTPSETHQQSIPQLGALEEVSKEISPQKGIEQEEQSSDSISNNQDKMPNGSHKGNLQPPKDQRCSGAGIAKGQGGKVSHQSPPKHPQIYSERRMLVQINRDRDLFPNCNEGNKGCIKEVGINDMDILHRLNPLPTKSHFDNLAK